MPLSVPASRLRTAVRRTMNAVLRPLGIAIGARSVLERGQRATYRGTLDHAKRVGFAPRTVIDVGVADGTFALYEAFPEARLVLIEPAEEARPHLEALAARFPRVEYVMAAAAESPGRVVLNVHRDIARISRYWESDYVPAAVTAREVAAVTLDQVRRDRNLEAPILLKIDVQGSELDVLRGAQQTLADTEYVILETSLFEFFRGGPLLSDVVAYMRDRDFVPYDVVGIHYRPLDGALSLIDVVFVRASGRFRQTHRFRAELLR